VPLDSNFFKLQPFPLQEHTYPQQTRATVQNLLWLSTHIEWMSLVSRRA